MSPGQARGPKERGPGAGGEWKPRGKECGGAKLDPNVQEVWVRRKLKPDGKESGGAELNPKDKEVRARGTEARRMGKWGPEKGKVGEPSLTRKCKKWGPGES